MENQSTDEIQIDIFRMINSVLRKWPLIFIVMCIAGYAGYSYNSDKIIPSYSSSGKIYVIDRVERELTVSIEDLDIGSRLVEDYKELVTSRIVLEQVIDQLGLDISYERLRDCLSVNNPEETRIIEISITYEDEGQIQAILNKIETVTCFNLSRKLGTERPTVLEKASTPRVYYESSVKKKAFIWMLGAAILVAGFFAVLDVFNLKIRYAKEVTALLQIEVIGNIPDASRKIFRLRK